MNAPAAVAANNGKRVVVALGGNAAYPPTIRGTAEEQLEVMEGLCEHFVRMINAGYQLGSHLVVNNTHDRLGVRLVQKGAIVGLQTSF